MSLERIHLRKLLQIAYSPAKKRTALLRENIRADIQKERGAEPNGGGDFHGPFWTDAKRHAAGASDLRAQTILRIRSNGRRERLYPKLQDGFLRWWKEARRARNVAFESIEESVKGKLYLEELDCTIKVENILALRVGDQAHRIIYPYFSEEPGLIPETGRLGLWVMSEALPSFKGEDLHVLDILRGASFGSADNPFIGNERASVVQAYKAVLAEWNDLRKEY